MARGDLTGRTLGDFVLADRLGEGGHGVVYRAHQPALGRDVVIKVLRSQRRGSPVAQERFLREAQLASLLDHPYAAHVYDFGIDEADDLMWIAMELVHGATLQEWLAQHGPMPLDQLVPFMEHVAQVVHAAHQHGIVHRDLKPSNVMVMDQGGSLFPKLLDFGIAKAPPDIASLSLSSGAGQPDDTDRAYRRRSTTRIRGAQREERVTETDSAAKGPDHPGPLTRPGSGIGSSAYMAPEQWRDAWTVGPASDIYSLGVMVYRAITGVDPFVGEHTGDYYHQHRDVAPPLLGGELAPIDRVLQRALAKTPDARHASALEFAADLRAALRATEREQLRAAAQQWEARRRSPGLLWGREEPPALERLARTAPGQLSQLECSFVASSHRRARRGLWLRRMLGLFIVAVVIAALLYRATMRTRIAEATASKAELEQGRSALLHGEPEALAHLTAAYEHEHTPSTAFMLARALEPRLAEQARLTSSSGRMWSATFSPDGRQIVTTDDESAQIWDAETYRRLFTLPHRDTVYRAVYCRGGELLVTASGDGSVRVWNPTNGELVRALEHQATRPRYYAVACSPDNRLVAAIDLEGSIAHVWEIHTGALLAELGNEGLMFSSAAFSADGQWLATGGGNDVRVYETKMWTRVLTIAGPAIVSLRWDPTSPRLLTGSAEGDVSLWAIPTGRRVYHLHESGEPIDAIAFSPDGRFVAAANRDGGEQIWSSETGRLRSQGNYLRGKLLSLEFDQSSTQLLASGASGSVAVADATRGMPIAILSGPRNAVIIAHFNPAAERVVGASWDGTARVWNAASPYRKWSSPPVGDNCGVVTSLEPDRRFVAVACQGHPTQIWDTDHSQLVAQLPSATPAAGDFMSAYPTVSTAGDLAAIARGRVVELYELPGGRLLRKIEHASNAIVTTVAFATTGRDVVSGATDGSLLVTRDNGAVLALPSSGASVDVVGFLPDGRIVAIDMKQRLLVYAATGTLLASIHAPARAMAFRISSDSQRLITISDFVRKVASPTLWDLEHYRSIATLETQGQGAVYSARFVTDGRVITTCADGAARLWDAASGRLRQTYRGGSRFLVDATLSGDGAMVVGGGGDGVLRFWATNSGLPLWTMPAHKSHLIAIRVDGDDIVTRGYAGDISRWTMPPPATVMTECSTRDRCAIVPP